MSKEYVNNGEARMTILTIYKGYDSSTYNFLQSFIYQGVSFPQITISNLESMSSTDYQNRLDNFVNYVYSLHEGLETDCPNLENGAEIYDTTFCPLTPYTQYIWEPI